MSENPTQTDGSGASEDATSRESRPGTADVNRRTVLGAIGSTGTLVLAGCAGQGGGDTPTPRVRTVVREQERTVVRTQRVTPTPDQFETRTVKFSLDWVPKGDHAGFLLAKQKGFWADRGLSVQLVRGYGSDQTVKEVQSGKSEFGLAGLGVVMSGIQQGLNIREYSAIYNNIPSIIMAHPDANIREPQDLEGTKTILPTGVNLALSRTLFNRLGLDWDSVDLETRGFVETAVLLNHEADWVSESGPDLPALWSAGFEPDAYNWLNEHLPIIAKGILIKDSFAENNPETVRRFIAGTLEGWQYVMSNGMSGIQEAVDALMKFFPQSALAEAPGGLSAEEFHLQNAQLMLSNLLTENTREHGLGYIPRDKAQSTVEIFNEYLLENGNLTVDDVFVFDAVDSGAYPIDFGGTLDAIRTVGDRQNPLLSHLE